LSQLDDKHLEHLQQLTSDHMLAEQAQDNEPDEEEPNAAA
jgi:hypothetical protein